MKKAISRIICLTLTICALTFAFSGCSSSSEGRVTDIINTADAVYISGTPVNTVEARMGAFQGKQGDYIEFRFTEPCMFNTIFINEKTANVRQYNIYAEIDGKYKLVHTGKNIFQENIVIEPVTATGIRLEIVNTPIGDDSFVIQGVSAYYIPQTTLEE